jgi:hypothetical protein
MKTYRGHQLVEPGIYFNARQLTFKSLDDDGRLPGGEVDVWRRVPALALLIVGPLMGLAYAIFLPLIGFAMVGGALLRKAGELAVEAGHATGRVLRPAWQPARAFFSRRRKAKGKAAPAKEGWLDDVKKRLDDRRDK